MPKGDYSLHVYSAGAVAPPLQEALSVFEKKENLTCRFTAGKPEALLKAIRLRKGGDIISAGSEYVHDEAEDIGVLLKGTRRSLGYRRSVIITQCGNPKGLKRLEDLCEPGVRVGTATGGCLKGVGTTSAEGRTHRADSSTHRGARRCLWISNGPHSLG